MKSTTPATTARARLGLPSPTHSTHLSDAAVATDHHQALLGFDLFRFWVVAHVMAEPAAPLQLPGNVVAGFRQRGSEGHSDGGSGHEELGLVLVENGQALGQAKRDKRKFAALWGHNVKGRD